MYAYTYGFNPRSPCGERQVLFIFYNLHVLFQSTLSVWRATRRELFIAKLQGGFNPRSPCGERQQGYAVEIRSHIVSIHALRVESD